MSITPEQLVELVEEASDTLESRLNALEEVSELAFVDFEAAWAAVATVDALTKQARKVLGLDLAVDLGRRHANAV